MKIAILYNFLDNIGGAEIMCLNLARELNADIYTTNINKGRIKIMGFEDQIKNIFSIGKIPVNAPIRQQIVLMRFERLKLRNKYDLYIIFGEWALSGALNNHPNIWYIHSPIREIWDMYEGIRNNLLWYKRPFFDMWVYYNRHLNKKYLKSVDRSVCNSLNTQKKIKQYLNIDSKILYPLIETTDFHFNKSGDYWLSVNRLINHKRVEIQLKAFEKLPLEKLIIVGSYEKSNHIRSYANHIKKIKPKNVEIKSFVSQKELIDLYANCKGTLTTSKDEDFGRLPIESMASGKPVIAPNEGGYKETVIDGRTGILIDDIDETKLMETIKKISRKLESTKIQQQYKTQCQKQAKNFDKQTFMKKLNEEIDKVLNRKNGFKNIND